MSSLGAAFMIVSTTFGGDMTAPRKPAAWMILLALFHIKTHAYGVVDLRSSPNPVPRPGHFKQAASPGGPFGRFVSGLDEVKILGGS
jgi:hypothetical protein